MQNRDRAHKRPKAGTKTEQEARDAVRRSVRFCRVLQEITAAASATSNPTQALRVGLEHICAFTGWPAGHICLSAGHGEPCLLSSDLWSLEDTQAYATLQELRRQARFLRGMGLPGSCLTTNQPVCTTQCAPGVALCKDDDLQSAGVAWSFAFPALADNEVVAVLEFFSADEEFVDDVIVDVLTCIGLQLGNIIMRQRAVEQLADTRRNLAETSHRAGIAEIATSALHNVGNVLNSVNVAASTICEKLRRSGTSDLKRAAGMLQEHQHDFATFATADDRGKHLPRFLVELSHSMQTEEETVLAELTNLIRNIDHIKDVVSIQQSYSGVSGTEEERSLTELVEDAIRINFASLERHAIHIVRDFVELPPIVIAKQKFLQIIVNLISNAKYALVESDNPDRCITLRLSRLGTDRARLEVQDNGVGIAPENLSRLFLHGFTTRKEGHGYGLHSAAALARELDAELKGDSDGPGRGATFVLEIPLKVKKERIHG